MLRGAIDLIHPEAIGGWVYSELGSLREQTILAFVDSKCIGSGKIDIFRKDLADAGLGDGYLGFRFPISVENPKDINRAIIRLDNSDAVLLQPSAKIDSAKSTDLFASPRYTMANIEWMRSRGWLEASEFTFLKYVHQIGAYDYSLVLPKVAGKSTSQLLDPVTAAQPMFDLLSSKNAKVKELNIPDVSQQDLRLLVATALESPLPIVAITSSEIGSISLLEGSHSEDVDSSASFVGAVDYPFGPDRLLFLNLTTTFKFNSASSSAVKLLAAV